jgi:hypothetical protein
MPHRPRAERELERIRAAASAARAARGSAVDAALAQIGAAFDECAAVNGFKLRVECWLQLSPQDAAVRARFGRRATLLTGRSLDAAVIMTERSWRDERKAFQIASVLGYGNRLSLDVLRELRLILRLMRFKRMQAAFDAAIAETCEPALAVAAE